MNLRKIFYYKNYSFNPQTGELLLSYDADNAKESFSFEEKITFPGAPFHLNETQNQILNHIFFLAHIAFGISYYKAFCPCELEVKSGKLSLNEALFFNVFYESGLGEFAVRNNMNLQGKINFPYQKTARQMFSLPLQKRFLIPVGGGKDSCLTIELMKELNQPAATIAIGSPHPIINCMKQASLPSFNICRQLDNQLTEINKIAANGHVPITGMLAFLLWASAILYDYQYVVLSCERSANSGNMRQGHLIINHQYSKSFEFEKNFYDLTQSVTPDFRYFSLLRPLSELAIAKLFSQKCRAYFPVFTSCNKAFRLNEKTRLHAWCHSCDKCRFVYLILAPFMEKETLTNLMGQALLNDPTQKEGYEELLGLSGHKPFECVGEIEESRLALLMLSHQKEWQNEYLIQQLTPPIQSLVYESELLKKYLTAENEHLIPKELIIPLFQLFKEAAQ